MSQVSFISLHFVFREGQTPNTQEPGGERRTTGSRWSERMSWAELCSSFEEALSREPTISSVGDGYFVVKCVCDKRLLQEKGEGV